MCLSDPDTAILIGGETADQNYCKDSLWKLELGQWSQSFNTYWLMLITKHIIFKVADHEVELCKPNN